MTTANSAGYSLVGRVVQARPPMTQLEWNQYEEHTTLALSMPSAPTDGQVVQVYMQYAYPNSNDYLEAWTCNTFINAAATT